MARRLITCLIAVLAFNATAQAASATPADARAAHIPQQQTRHGAAGVIQTCGPHDACWDGYAFRGSNLTSVSGAWTVPSVSLYTRTASSIWVGIGGEYNTELLQVGTSQVVNSDGTTEYRAWYEDTYNACYDPATQTKGACPLFLVQPGDRMIGMISQVTGNMYSVWIEDVTTGQTIPGGAIPVNTVGPLGKSADWIMEAPQNTKLCPTTNACLLAHFSPTGFDSMMVNGEDPYLSGLQNLDEFVLIQAGVQYTPSDLSREYDAFNVAYIAQPGPPQLNPHHRIAVARNSNGELEVFLVGENDQLYTSTETSANGLFNGGWHSLGGTWPNGEAVTVGTNADGRLELFMVGADSQVYHDYQTTPSGSWSGWGTLGGRVSNMDSIAVARDRNGHLNLFVIGVDGHRGDGHLYTKVQNPTAISGWAAWSEIGGSLTWPTYDTIGVGANQDGRLQLFLAGTNQALYSLWQASTTNMSAWTMPTTNGFGGGIPRGADLPVGRNADGRLEIFVVGTNSLTYHDFQKTPNGGWSGWGQLGSTTDTALNPSFTVGPNGNGRLQVFLLEQDANMYSNYQLSSGWSGWFKFATGITTPGYDAIGIGSDLNGGLNLFLVDQTTHQLYTKYQPTPNGSWSAYQTLGGAWFD